MTNADLVDGYLLELAQTRLLKAVLQVAFLDVLDGIPADAEMMGHVLNRHEPTQLQGITLKSLDVTATRVGEGQRDLTGDTTRPALDPRDRQDDPGGLVSDRHGSERACLVAVVDDLPRATLRTTAGARALLDGEHNGPLGLFGLDVVVATKAEGVVQ
jgi:hypothetical protein